MKIVVDDREYNVKKVGPFLVPMFNYISHISTKTARDAEEALKLSEELEKAVNNVIEVCIEGEVPEKDKMAVLGKLGELLGEMVGERKIELFRNE